MFSVEEFSAILAFVAFGANFLGGSLLLLFNPRSRAVRWFAVFTMAQLLWLMLQGLHMLNELPSQWWRVYAVTVHLLPALFCAAALAQVRARSVWLPLLPVAIALLLLPLLMPDPVQSPLTPVWHGMGWGIPAVLYFRSRQLKSSPPLPPGSRVLNLILTAVVPAGVVGAIVLGGGFVFFFLPLMTIAAQLLIFTGVVHHRYYDIEVRAARSGELAAGAAERDRLALLGELAATIAHEVRNPLTGIRSLTQRIAEAPLEDEKRAHYAEVILGEITRLDRFVGNLTDMARRGNARDGDSAGPTELRPLFDDLCLLVDSRARRAGARIVAAPAEVSVGAPREPLAQALLNLLLNALAHAPEGSVVELGAEPRAGHIAIHVRDHGPGIPAELRERIFEPFHTDSGGTGLGLTVVRRLAQEHEWSLDLVDAQGGGAEFRLTVPAARA
jgi:signal transduction histidine kinase